MDGVLVLAKPPGPTSHDAVALARRLTGTRRIGHGGTLDPFASGVLPLFLGGATRLAEYHLGDRKSYRATVCFGASSTTDDLDGELTPVVGPVPDAEAVMAALERFRGEIRQRPPAYSAIQVGGRRSYSLAREGMAPELPERTVTIHEIELVAWNADDPARPIGVVDVTASAGTYVRALARDLGAAVGSAAYLGALVRTASGPFRLEDAVTLDALRAAAAGGPAAVARLLLPVDAGLEWMPSIRLTPGEIADAAMGRYVRPAAGVGGLPPGRPIRLLDGAGQIVGIGALDGRRIAPEKMLPGTAAGPAAVGARRARPGVGRMAVVPGIDRLAGDIGRLFVVVGVFDGLHLGHLYLLDHLREEASRRDALPTVITFDHHPDEILTGAAPPLLCDPDERLELLEAAGVAVTVVQHFDVALRMTEFDGFIRRIADRSPLAGFLMTPDSAFGHERRGTPAAVAALGATIGYDVAVIPSLELDGRAVRSAEIRSDIAVGDLAGAARLLGRPYAVVGEGSGGDGHSVRVAFPMPVALPSEGEYAVRYREAEVGDPDADAGQPGLGVIDAAGHLTLRAARIAGSRLRVTFD